MSKFDKDIKQIQELAKTYKFKQPVDPAIQDYMLSVKSGMYKNVLSSAGKLSLIQKAALSVYFTAKKYALLSVPKVLISLSIIGSVTAGSIIVYNNANRVTIKSISINPEKVECSGTNKTATIQITALTNDDNKKDITEKAVFKITPAGLAKLRSSKQKNTQALVFLKQGTGKLEAAYKTHKAIIPISYKKTKPDIKTKKTAIDKLYDQYRHIERVILKDGNIFTGVMFRKGDAIKLITPGGTLHLKNEDIRRVEYVRK